MYYEVWNEPDLFGSWKRSGNRNYLTMYTYSARGANAAQNVKPFKFGGPAITALYKNWFYDLLNMTRKNNLRMDFFSWHRYNKNINQFENDIAEVEEWIAADFPEYQNLEMVISEWGHDSNNHPGYDTTFGAAHTVATAIQMIGSVDKGFVFEIEDGKDPAEKAQWGRWGLLTNQAYGAQPKPRYNALRLLDRIGPTRLDLLGKGSWVKAAAARDEKNQISVVMANYDPEVSNVETVPLTFTNVSPGSYTFRQTFLGGRTNTEEVATSEATLRRFVTMGTNSVAFVELIPLNAATPSATEVISPPTQTTPGETLVTPSIVIPTALPQPVPVSTSSATPERTGFGRLIE